MKSNNGEVKKALRSICLNIPNVFEEIKVYGRSPLEENSPG